MSEEDDVAEYWTSSSKYECITFNLGERRHRRRNRPKRGACHMGLLGAWTGVCRRLMPVVARVR